ncbi:MAG: ATP-binding cassette domain-containing protein [Bacteroidetes bacterium]|nr:ATP-binding cassette domain-containing protein [Bacteroidota bacterium]
MLRAENISFQIGKRILLHDISVDFSSGKINLILGANGAGKSTLIKILSGMIPPQSGNIFYGNQNIKQIKPYQLAQSRAVLSQNIDVSFPLTVWEVVLMGRYPFFRGAPSAKDKAVCEETITYFDLQEFRHRNYATLSGGEKQRVHFARVAAQIWLPQKQEGNYLLLDEPLTFLDVYYQFDFMNKLCDLVKMHGWTAVGVVHDLNLAGKYGDHITLMYDGRILTQGEKASVLTKENIYKAYGLYTETVLENNSVRLHF